jgi:hypothetical protein
MNIMRLLVHGGILALFGIAAVVAMTFLFSAQIRFDQAAELQIRGHATPRAASMIVTAAHGLFSNTGETRASPGDNLSSRGEDEVLREATASLKPLVYRLDHPLSDPLESRAQAADRSPTRTTSVSEPIEAGPPPKADSRFTSVRVTRPGAEPTVYRVPRERATTDGSFLKSAPFE